MIRTKKVEIKWSNRVKQWYIDKGYQFTKNGDLFYATVEDLSPSCTVEIEYLCDYCGAARKNSWAKISSGRQLVDKDSCFDCLGKKLSAAKQASFQKYIESIYDASDSVYKMIPLSPPDKNAYALVDYKHYEYLVNLCRWFLAQGYAVGNIKQEDGTYKQVPMHRIIMNCPPELEVEHISRDKLLNIEDNLRIRQRNDEPKHIRPNKERHSVYKGLTMNRDKWEARIIKGGHKYRIGYFSNEIAAANAYNRFAEKLFGEYANINECPFMEESEWRGHVVGRQPIIPEDFS